MLEVDAPFPCPKPLVCHVDDDYKMVVSLPTDQYFVLKVDEFCRKTIGTDYLNECRDAITDPVDPVTNLAKNYWLDGRGTTFSTQFSNDFELGLCNQPEDDKLCVVLRTGEKHEEFARVPLGTFLDNMAASAEPQHYYPGGSAKFIVEGGKFVLPVAVVLTLVGIFGGQILDKINKSVEGGKRNQEKKAQSESLRAQARALNAQADGLEE